MRLVVFYLALAVCASAQSLTEFYKQVLRPGINRAAPVENAAFDWEALHFTLAKGEIYLAAPVNGHVTAAVFIGQGQLALTPPSPIEAGQIRLFRGQDHLQEAFTQAVFRFGDAANFLQALGDAVHFQPTSDAAAANDLLDQRAKLIDELGRPQVARVMLAMRAAVPDRLLIAELRLVDDDWIEADFDPLEQEPLRVHNYAENKLAGTDEFDDTWTQFAPAGRIAPSPWHLDQYNLGVRIPDNLDLAVQASFDVRNDGPASAGLLLSLLSNLRVTGVTTADGAAVGWLQPVDPGAAPSSMYSGNWLYLELPQALASGQSVALTVTYHGRNVVQGVGSGNFFCSSEGWYPGNLFGPPMQRANFKMNFVVNKKYTAVVTGRRDGQSIVGDQAVSQWSTPVPLTVAGFALGDYQELDGPAGADRKLQVQIFSNRQPDDAMAFTTMAAADANVPIGTLDTIHLAPQILADVQSAISFMSAYFGPLPYSKLSVTDVPGSYGQGWPTLLYLSSLSYLDTTQLDALGIHGNAMRELTSSFRAHETSHQWWGHVVSWQTPHDQWLSEGFANASAVLYENAADGPNSALADLKQWQHDLLSKDQFGHVPEQLGPLWLGDRLSSSVDPSGYSTVVYDKGGYVLLMLHSMMQGAMGANADAAFIAMMRDFTATYAQRDASTEDFKAIVEKHMLPGMDLDHNHSMDWFFNEYVYGTGVPTLTFTYSLEPGANGATMLRMKVDNPGGWKGLLPIYIYKDNKHLVRGQLPITKAEEAVGVPVSFRPSKVVANANLDMLVQVNQTSFR